MIYLVGSIVVNLERIITMPKEKHSNLLVVLYLIFLIMVVYIDIDKLIDSIYLFTIVGCVFRYLFIAVNCK